MTEGSGMETFSKCFPKRRFDVATFEQYSVTFSSGLVLGGYKPVLSVYFTF
ncbi:hypothetical protein [Buchnera aphidicola]|uniref:hypothetical protein n=1 Tax=Buchnera aphidicola TaxID=9 RepID=UPI0002E7D636|nr:hypothetical protein [Buchnera aphidicola]